MADIEKIAEDLSNLTVLEAAELAKLLEDKWGVSAAAAPVAVAAAAGGDAGGAAAEEKSEFDVVLAAAGASK
ncbi:MAG: 50S ribosomal protein L7/L12, partial [Candidatus Puniceispirillaceae bacterium]